MTRLRARTIALTALNASLTLALLMCWVLGVSAHIWMWLVAGLAVVMLCRAGWVAVLLGVCIGLSS